MTPTTTAAFDESALVEKARAGDAQAFTELVNHYERKIYRLAKHITQNDEDAEDVLQEAFLKAYEHLDGFKGDSKFYTWIVRIAVNEALMKLRKRKGDRTVSLDEPVDTGEETVQREIAVWEYNPEQRYSREEMQTILDEAVQTLKPDFRTVFMLRDIEELSTEETAETLGISIPAVKSRLLGVVLNAVDSSAPDYYYSYRYYPYAYGYGYGEDVAQTPQFPAGPDEK